MRTEAYRLILLASLAGGGVGALVLWNRRRTQVRGRNAGRGCVVIASGTMATIAALLAFAEAFEAQPAVYAAMVVLLSTGWVAAINSVFPLPLPRSIRLVRSSEFAFLASRWSGVRIIGYVLRSAALRGLGGAVYLKSLKGDVPALLRGLDAAQTVHVWGLLMCSPWFAVWAVQGQWASLVSGFIVNGVINVLPALHLRYVTARVDQIAARVEARRSRGSTIDGGGCLDEA